MRRLLKAVNIELTRRCNMNCEFCARGEAQNIDMSTEIIDKTLDELNNFELYSVMVTGGEIMLNKQGFIYLIDEIIRRDLKICNCSVFTNGTVRDTDIKAALVRIGKHCKKCVNSDWGRKVMLWKEKYFTLKYNVNQYASLIISTHFHDNSNIISDTIAFYNDGVDPEIMNAVNQTNSAKSNDCDDIIVLEGNADKNLLSLYDKGYNKFQLYGNKYCLIFQEDDQMTAIEKTINISANGNVTAGCTQSYEHADNRDRICNILNCSGNLFDYIDKYSWTYPLNIMQAGKLIQHKTLKYLYDRGINQFPDSIDIADSIKYNDCMINAIENYAELIKEVHEKYYTLTHIEAQEMAGFIAATYDYGIGNDVLKDFILEYFCENPDLTDDDIQAGIQMYVAEHLCRVSERKGAIGVLKEMLAPKCRLL